MLLYQRLLFYILLLAMLSCRHDQPVDVLEQMRKLQDTCPDVPYSAILVILDKQGNNLITSVEDVVTTTPVSATTARPIHNSVFRLRQNSADTTLSTKYGGKGLAVGSAIPTYSMSGKPDRVPINPYLLAINGKTIGKIACNVKALSFQDGCFTPTIVQFDDQVVPIDSTVVPWAYIIQLKQ